MRAAVVSAIVLVTAAVGCGSEGNGDAVAPRTETTSADPASTELEITFWPTGQGNSNPQRWTLTCDPPGGTHPSHADACSQLAALESPFAPQPPNVVCTEQYGGPEEAFVEGTFRGKPVSYGLARTNGCQIGRFEQYRFLLPGGGAS